MKVTALIGSPRKGKNTDTLVSRFLQGCFSQGSQTEKIYLADCSIKACRFCRTQDGKGCTFNDDMDRIYHVFESSDGIVLGTPIFYNSVSTFMKQMIDRCYCMAKMVKRSGSVEYITTVKKKKLGFIILVGGSGKNPDCAFPEFQIWAPEVNIRLAGKIAVSRALLNTEPQDDEKTLDLAYLEGIKFAKNLTEL